MTTERPQMTGDDKRVDAFLADEGDLSCPACDGSIERDSAGTLGCDMCGREWTANEVIERNLRRMSLWTQRKQPNRPRTRW